MTIQFNPAKVNPNFTHTHPDGEWANFPYNDNVEDAASKALFARYDIQHAPPKYFPAWDYVVNHIGKIEQKLKCSLMRAGDLLPIEIRQPYAHNPQMLKPSGLMLTESDFYLTLTWEWNKGMQLIKCRLVSTQLLRLEGKAAIQDETKKEFLINSFEFPHVWVGDFYVNSDNTWNLSKAYKLNTRFEQKLIEYINLVNQVEPETV